MKNRNQSGLPAAVLLCVLVAFLMKARKDDKDTVTTSTIQSAHSSIVPQSDAEKIAFYEQHLQGIVLMLHSNAIPYAILQTQRVWLDKAILQRYGKPYDMEIAINYHPDDAASQNLAGANAVGEYGNPEIRFYIPRVIQLYQSLERTGGPNWKEKFTNDITAVYFHELVHLSALLIDPERRLNVENEIRAWALTCEHVIAPMLEQLHLPMSVSAMDYYNAWVKSGRNEKSPVWREAIKELYR